MQGLKASAAEPATVDVHGLEFAVLTERQCVEHLVRSVRAGQGGWIVTPNLDIVLRCTLDPAVGELVRRADIRVADGTTVVWASRLQGTPLPERVCGSNLIWSISQGAAEHGLRVYMLGGAEGMAESARRALTARYPNLQVVGTYYPPYGFEKDPRQYAAMMESVSAARPDVVFVALSFPKGERLIEHIRAAAPAAWWIGVGISFSFVAGAVKRAPVWMRRCGLEWVHRMAQEPGRLVRRYLIDDLPFVFRLFARAIGRRWSAR
jgi:N-acetylglucosaminyldiphosphoundecaprenol N-acetyl-beta-D-mannosaminyltransferase